MAEYEALQQEIESLRADQVSAAGVANKIDVAGTGCVGLWVSGYGHLYG
jgi:hypothetical protein